jgi:hypothetical protein
MLIGMWIASQEPNSVRFPTTRPASESALSNTEVWTGSNNLTGTCKPPTLAIYECLSADVYLGSFSSQSMTIACSAIR